MQFFFIQSELFDLFSLQRDQVFAQDQVALIIEQLRLVNILEVLELSKYVKDFALIQCVYLTFDPGIPESCDRAGLSVHDAGLLADIALV